MFLIALQNTILPDRPVKEVTWQRNNQHLIWWLVHHLEFILFFSNEHLLGFFSFYIAHFLWYFNDELHFTLLPLLLPCLISPQLPVNVIECTVCLFLRVPPNLALSRISNRRMHSVLTHYIYYISPDLGRSHFQNPCWKKLSSDQMFVSWFKPGSEQKALGFWKSWKLSNVMIENKFKKW